MASYALRLRRSAHILGRSQSAGERVKAKRMKPSNADVPCFSVRIFWRTRRRRTLVTSLSDHGGVGVHRLGACGQVLQFAQHVSGQGETLRLGSLSQRVVYVVGNVS